MAIVEVSYLIPVGAIIDTEAEEVTSVLEFGDLIKLEVDDLGHTPVIDPETGQSVDSAIAEKAIEIAESNSWPARDIG
jgi:hypothetical protein